MMCEAPLNVATDGLLPRAVVGAITADDIRLMQYQKERDFKRKLREQIEAEVSAARKRGHR
jgi:hypothetical protein